MPDMLENVSQGPGWTAFMDPQQYLQYGLILLTASFSGAILAYHPVYMGRPATMEDLELRKTLIIYSTVGALISIICSVNPSMAFVIFGIGGRSLLPGLKLMQVPRLSVVFTLVAVVMALTLSFLDFIHFNPSGLVVLLPLVVLTNIIDRAYTVADESGVRNALLRLGWTIAVASVCVLIFRWQRPGQLLLAYPELHLITLALIIGLGLYGWRKLTDFPVFHFLVEDRKKEKKLPADTVE